MIFTSYFALTKKLIETGYEPISISRFPPKFFEGKKALGLAPSEHILKRYKDGYINEEQYTKEYIEYLESRKDKIVNYLRALFLDERNIVFLCYEKSGVFCHRRILADWFKKNTGLEMPEIDKNIL